MNALDVYTKINIRDYLARPEEKYDKEYSKERQEIRKSSPGIRYRVNKDFKI